MKRNLLTGFVLAALIAVFAMGSMAGAAPQIAVGSKDFTEQVILGHLVAEYLEAHGYETKKTLGLGGDDVVFAGLLRGDLDIWVSYSGTLWSVILKNPLEVGADPAVLYEKSRDALKELHNIEMLDSLGFNNTYVFAAPRALVEQHNLKTVSDLIPIANTLTLGGSLAFMGDRPEGIKGVEEMYGLKFRRTRAIESGLMFQALQLRQVDLIVPFSTHGQIVALDLVMLEDDRQLFPPYDAGLLVRGELLEAHPEVRDLLDKLSGSIDDNTMAAMNYEVDGHRKDPKDVAINFLKEHGFID